MGLNNPSTGKENYRLQVDLKDELSKENNACKLNKTVCDLKQTVQLGINR